MNVQNIIRKEFITVTVNDTLAKVMGKFRSTGHHHAIVLSSTGKYQGVVSKRRFLTSRQKIDQVKVGKVLVRVTRVSPDLELDRLAKCFLD